MKKTLLTLLFLVFTSTSVVAVADITCKKMGEVGPFAQIYIFPGIACPVGYYPV